jgi:hypothetical protein
MVWTFHIIDTIAPCERILLVSEKLSNLYYAVKEYLRMVATLDQDIMELPNGVELPCDEPFDGLFNSKMRSRLVEEIVSDPYHKFRPKEMADLLETTYPTLRSHFMGLVDSQLLIKDESDKARPRYRVNFESKKIIALSLLMDAINDDRGGTDTMDRAIINYYNEHLSRKYQDIIGRVNLIAIKADKVDKITIEGQDESFPVTISKGSA